MAKVYDALRRAEEERRKYSDTAAQPIARLEWEPEVAPATAARSAPRPPRESLFRRVWPKALSLGRRVLLVDCDLRRPRVHSALGLRPKAGLSEVLNGEVAFEEAVMRADGADLDVLAVRDRPVNPSELLSSPGMRDLIAS